MGSLYPRRNKWWVAFVDASGTRRLRATPYALDQRAEAEAVLAELERLVAAEKRAGAGAGKAGVTVADFATPWVARQEARGIHSAYTYRSIITHHVLPRFGAMLLRDVRPREVHAWVDEMRAAGHAPKSIRNRHGLLHRLLADAVVQELLTTNPATLGTGALPKKQDADREWRSGAVFSREEAWTLVSAASLPLERRVLHTFMFVAGLRFGEAAAIRWRHWQRVDNPLGRLLVASSFSTRLGEEKVTKSERPRVIPVHPVLDELLHLYAQVRIPRPDDLVLVGPETARQRKDDDPHLTHQTAYKRWAADLERLGLRHRRMHDARRTFVSLALGDGARKDVLRWVSHGGSGDIMDAYTTLPWPTLCEAVSTLRLPPDARAASATRLLHGAKSGGGTMGYDTEGVGFENTTDAFPRGGAPVPPRSDAAKRRGRQSAARASEGGCSNIATLGASDEKHLAEVAEWLAAVLARGKA
jgi:integrase